LVLLGIWDFFGTFGYFGYLGKKISLSKYILSAPFDQVSPDILSVQQLSFLFFMFLLFHIFPFLLFSMVPYFESFFSAIYCFASKMLQFLDFLSFFQ